MADSKVSVTFRLSYRLSCGCWVDSATELMDTPALSRLFAISISLTFLPSLNFCLRQDRSSFSRFW